MSREVYAWVFEGIKMTVKGDAERGGSERCVMGRKDRDAAGSYSDRRG